MILQAYRITKTPTFVWNNRHFKNVRPKHAVFVIDYEPPYQRYHTKLWIDYLKREMGRQVLYLHTVKVETSRVYRKVHRKWKRHELVEVVIPVDFKGHTQIMKTVRV